MLSHFSRVRLFATPWTGARQASLSITNSRSLLKLMSIESVTPPNHLILCCPLLLPPSIFPSIRVFSNESILLIRWPKYWSFSFNISPSNEHSGLISCLLLLPLFFPSIRFFSRVWFFFFFFLMIIALQCCTGLKMELNLHSVEPGHHVPSQTTTYVYVCSVLR